MHPLHQALDALRREPSGLISLNDDNGICVGVLAAPRFLGTLEQAAAQERLNLADPFPRPSGRRSTRKERKLRAEARRRTRTSGKERRGRA